MKSIQGEAINTGKKDKTLKQRYILLHATLCSLSLYLIRTIQNLNYQEIKTEWLNYAENFFFRMMRRKYARRFDLGISQHETIKP